MLRILITKVNHPIYFPSMYWPKKSRKLVQVCNRSSALTRRVSFEKFWKITVMKFALDVYPLYARETFRMTRKEIMLFFTDFKQNIGFAVKPNYSKKQCSLSVFTSIRWYYRFKLAWSTQQASSMHLIHGTSLLSTPLPLWTYIIYLR